MSAVEIIAAALAAGASAGVTGVATSAVQDAYERLKSLVDRPQAIAELEETGAAAPVWQARLSGEIAENDPAVLAAAERLIVLLNGAPGRTVQIDARGSQGSYFGDGGTVHNTFGP